MNNAKIFLAELFKGIDEVEEMLLFNIVQGRRNQRGNYGTVYLEFAPGWV
jgi:hypothetical protein